LKRQAHVRSLDRSADLTDDTFAASLPSGTDGDLLVAKLTVEALRKLEDQYVLARVLVAAEDVITKDGGRALVSLLLDHLPEGGWLVIGWESKSPDAIATWDFKSKGIARWKPPDHPRLAEIAEEAE